MNKNKNIFILDFFQYGYLYKKIYVYYLRFVMNIFLDDFALSTFNTAQITDKSEETFKTDLWKVMLHSSLLVKQDILLSKGQS